MRRLQFRKAVAERSPGTHVLDLARLTRELPEDKSYQSIAW